MSVTDTDVLTRRISQFKMLSKSHNSATICMIAVFPFSSTAFRSELAAISFSIVSCESCLFSLAWAFSAADIRGVHPPGVRASTQAPCSSMLWMISGSPRHAAECSAVSPYESTIARSAPVSNTRLKPIELLQMVFLTCLDQCNAYRRWNEVRKVAG